jgi:hypothetical protein
MLNSKFDDDGPHACQLDTLLFLGLMVGVSLLFGEWWSGVV